MAYTYGSGKSITPDGAIVVADGTVIDSSLVTVIGSSDAAKEMIRHKTVGWGSLGALEKPGESVRTPGRGCAER